MPGWIEQLVAALPAWVPPVASGVALFSLVAFVGSLLLLPWLVRRLPADYFLTAPAARSRSRRALSTAVGVLLLVAGALMLVLPGQGLLTIGLGLGLVDLPFWSAARKRALLLRIARRPAIRSSLDRLRSEPLRFPPKAGC